MATEPVMIRGPSRSLQAFALNWGGEFTDIPNCRASEGMLKTLPDKIRKDTRAIIIFSRCV